MKKTDLKKYDIPSSPGVYFFKKGGLVPHSSKSDVGDILYIGKATSLKDRVRSYFNPDVLHTRGSRIVDMVTSSDTITFEKTDSVLEALILEANLIKKYEPKYNVKEKDDKSYNFVCITSEKEPRVVIERGRTIEFSQKSKVNSQRYSDIYGPFPSQVKLGEALKIIRKIFPFKTDKSYGKFYSQIGLDPKPKDLKKNIRNIKLFLNGRKKALVLNLEKEMMKKAKELKFEEAGEIKRQIYALSHINDVALIEESENRNQESEFRIESFDVAHMSGKNSVGVMTVFEGGKVKKSDYKKFILKDTKRGDDVGGLREILTRRLKHPEWGTPDLIVVDGGKGQINQAKKIIKNIPIVSVLKDDKHKPKDILGNSKMAKMYEKEILISNNEAHRFAINFFRSKQLSALLKSGRKN